MSIDQQVLLAAALGTVSLVGVIYLANVLRVFAGRLREMQRRIVLLQEAWLIQHLADDTVARQGGAATNDPSERPNRSRNGFENAITAPGPQRPCRAESLPQVILSEGVLQQMVRRWQREHQRRPGVEFGFALVGRNEGQGEGRRIVVNALVDSGDFEDRSAGHVRFDRDYQQARLERLQWLDPRASHVGDAHSHPGGMDHCSGGDLQTDRANVMASNTREMVFAIATETIFHNHRPIDPTSVYGGGYKIDVFYLGKASGYQYEKVTPRIDPGEPMLMFPASLEALASADPERFRLDWACLRSLRGWDLRVSEVELDGRCSASIELASRAGRGAVVLMPGDSADVPPTVFVDRGGSLERFAPDFLDGRWTPHIWLAQVALRAIDALGRLGRPSAPDHGAAGATGAAGPMRLGEAVDAFGESILVRRGSVEDTRTTVPA